MIASHDGTAVCTSSQQSLTHRDFLRKLGAMQTYAETSGASTEASFSAMLSAITSHSSAQHLQNDAGLLQDDVVSLSYEQALRTLARNRPSSSVPIDAERPDDSFVQREAALREPIRSQIPASHRRASRSKLPMSSSVTIRLDEAECMELRARAAEAGLTVSAYLRSCIFEVDDLRTQVKQTLAQMRTAPTPPVNTPAIPLQAPSTGWRDRIFPRWTLHRSAAHA